MRTRYPLANQVPSQLSYRPVTAAASKDNRRFASFKISRSGIWSVITPLVIVTMECNEIDPYKDEEGMAHMKDWGPGAPKVPLKSDEDARDRKRAKRLARAKRRQEKWEESRKPPRKDGA